MKVKIEKKCENCERDYISTRASQKYCSIACSNSRDKRGNFQISKNCKECGKEFITDKSNKKYCTVTCRENNNRKKFIKKVLSPRKCTSCDVHFNPKTHNQIYCSIECQEKYYIYHGRKVPLKSNINCKNCGKEFTPRLAHQVFCTKGCQGKYYYESMGDSQKSSYIESAKSSAKKKYLDYAKMKQLGKANYVNFGDLRLWREKEFEKWFKNNYVLFGLKSLVKINRLFPDVIAEAYDGTKLNIELELCAPNFKAHNHNPALCDLIVSYVKPYRVEHIQGVPIISIFNSKGLVLGMADYDPDTLQLTEYFQNIVEICNTSLIKFLKTSQFSKFHEEI